MRQSFIETHKTRGGTMSFTKKSLRDAVSLSLFEIFLGTLLLRWTVLDLVEFRATPESGLRIIS